MRGSAISKTKISFLNKLRGFTLVELLVVIAIISILSSLGLMSYLQAQRSARDAQRKSDIKQYQVALESFANNNGGGTYPVRTSTATDMCDDPGSLLASAVIASCPDYLGTDATYRYQYVSDGLNYYVYFRMEGKANSWFVGCSNGRTGDRNTAPVGLSCPI